jgi:hypothetical protein
MIEKNIGGLQRGPIDLTSYGGNMPQFSDGSNFNFSIHPDFSGEKIRISNENLGLQALTVCINGQPFIQKFLGSFHRLNVNNLPNI